MTGEVSIQDRVKEGGEAPPRIVRISENALADRIALALILLVALWRAWAVLKWTFQADDWAYVAYAARLPFFRFITMSYHGHLQVGQFVVVWLVTRIAPLNYGVAVAPVLIATCLGGLILWRLLTELFGPRPANLIPLAVFMLCPLSVPPALWWAASLQTIPLQLFIVATLLAVLRYVRDPSTRRLIVVGLAYGGALLFWEKAVLIVPLVIMFVLLFLGKGTGRDRLRSVTIGRWHLWAALGGLTAAYASWYLLAAPWQLSNRPGLTAVRQLATTTLGSTVVPSYLGGPWAVSAWGGVVFKVTPLTRVFSWSLAAGVVGASVFIRRQAWRAWILPLVYVVLNIALVASSRLSLIGPVIGLSSRYVADSVPVFALALALAFSVPLERRTEPAWARRVLVVDTPQVTPTKADRMKDRLRTMHGWPWTRLAVVMSVIILYAISAMITNTRIAGLAEGASAKDWLATVRSQLAAHPTASIFDGYLPAKSIPAALFPRDARASRALGPIAPHVRWDAPDEHPLMFDVSGHLRPVDVGRVTSADRGPTRGCGYLIYRTPVTAPLKQKLFSWGWGVRLGYYTNKDAIGFVTVDGDRQPVHFLRGPHTLTLIHYGTAGSVTIEAGGSPICVGEIRVGGVKPLAG